MTEKTAWFAVFALSTLYGVVRLCARLFAKITATWDVWSTADRGPNEAWPFTSVLGYSTAGFTLNVGTTKQRSASGYASDLVVDFLNPTDLGLSPSA